MLNITLNILYLIPIIGIIFIIILPKNLTKIISLTTAIISFLYSLLFTLYYNPILPLQLVESYTIFGKLFIVGIDGISLNFILLTAFILPICILTSYNSITTFIKEFYICLLSIELLLFGVFSVMDLLGFYILYEGVLIPMFLIIGV
jgi:NADH-quinone oxidoreductase subunit M